MLCSNQPIDDPGSLELHVLIRCGVYSGCEELNQEPISFIYPCGLLRGAFGVCVCGMYAGSAWMVTMGERKKNYELVTSK